MKESGDRTKHALKVIECSGTPREMGRQYGEQARDDIRQDLALRSTHWDMEALGALPTWWCARRQDVVVHDLSAAVENGARLARSPLQD